MLLKANPTIDECIMELFSKDMLIVVMPAFASPDLKSHEIFAYAP
jgi:hypothetical protein